MDRREVQKRLVGVLGRMGFVLVLLAFAAMGGSIYRTSMRIKNVQNIIEKEEEEVLKLEEEKKELERRIQKVKDVDYIERQLRDKLGLAKGGEVVLIMPSDEVLRSLSPKLDEEEDVLPLPNWRKWLNLFL